MSSGKVTTLDVLEIDEGPAGNLPYVVDDMSLAFRLGFKNQTLWWLLKKPYDAFTPFEIPKANGKKRLIHKPHPAMGKLLDRFRRVFLLPLIERLGEHVTAYRPGRGIRKAADRHIHACAVCDQYDVPHTCEVVTVQEGEEIKVRTSPGCKACDQPPKHDRCPRRGIKIHLDLRDFFGNTRASWIREYFQDELGYSRYVSGLIARLLTVPLTVVRPEGPREVRGVPQGAPTSGDICNLVADRRLDRPVMAALRDTGWTYSRYADDIYLSHPENLSGEEVGRVITLFNELVKAAGWRVNWDKLHVQRPKYQQRLLGTVLNRKVNIPPSGYRQLRCLIHRCYRDGFNAEAQRSEKSTAQLHIWIRGKISWFTALNPAKANRLLAAYMVAKEKHGNE